VQLSRLREFVRDEGATLALIFATIAGLFAAMIGWLIVLTWARTPIGGAATALFFAAIAAAVIYDIKRGNL
jgi:hypothetical protein